MTRNQMILVAALGSLALLAGAFAFQWLGYLPCRMCLWQRWPHAAAVVIGAFALFTRGPLFPGLGALAALTTSGIGVFHTGVERDWWEGPASCTGSRSLTELSGADLLSTDSVPALVMCDQVSWALGGLSMASWNALASLALAVIWVMAARRRAA